MGVVLYRVDDRLIHGQVVEGWFHHLHPDCIVVADDEAAGNAFQRSIMELAVPYGVRTDILTVEEFVMHCREQDYDAKRAIVLFRFPRDVLEALDFGLSIDRLNLGGLHATAKAKSLCKGVIASEEDLRDLKAILASGVQVEIRPVPSEPPLDLRGLM